MFPRTLLLQQGGRPLSRGLPRALDDELSARGADVAPAALAHRDDDAVVGQRPREAVDTGDQREAGM